MKTIRAVTLPTFVRLWGVAVLLLVATLAFAGLGHSRLGFVAKMDSSVATADHAMDWLRGLGLAAILGALLVAIPLPKGDRGPLLLLWGAKTLVVLGFMLFYESHYSSLDAYGYYSHSLGPLPLGDLRFNDGTTNMYRLAWFQQRALVSFSALKVSCAFLGLLGVYAFYRGAVLYLGKAQGVLLLGLGLFPSVLFWSSILGKDPLVFLALGLLAYSIAAFAKERDLRGMASVAGGIVILAYIRPWLIPVAALPVALPLLVRAWRRSSRTLRPVILAISIVIGAGAVAFLGSILRVRTIGSLLPAVNFVSRAWAEGGSGESPPEFRTMWDLVRFLPYGSFTALFRPLPGELSNLFGLLAGAESVLLLAILALGVARMRPRNLADPILVSSALFVLTWVTLYSFISFQNLGTAVRFRLQAVPALLAFSLLLGRGTTFDALRARFTWAWWRRAVMGVRSWVVAAVRRTRTVLDLVAAGAVALPLVTLALIQMGVGRRRRALVEPRRLLVVDTAYTLREVRQRGLSTAITCRDLEGYFDHVWTVHPLAGAGGEGVFAGPIEVTAFAPRHTVIEAHPGRFVRLAVWPRLNFVLAQASLATHLRRLIQERGISAVRIGDPYYQGILGRYLARSCGVPLVVRISGNDDEIFQATGRAMYPRLFPSRKAEKAVERAILSRADLVAGANQNNLEAAIRNGARKEHGVVFRYGNLVHPAHFVDPMERPDVARLRDEVAGGAETLLLFVGRLEPAKRVEDLVGVMVKIARVQPKAKLVVVGDGSLRKDMEKEATSLGIDKSIAFVGVRSQEWIASLAPSATVIVSPHMGRALVECALAGVPMVAYDLDWQRELVVDGRTGFLVASRDVGAMSEAVLRLLRDPDLARTMGARARQLALEMMDPARLMSVERDAYSRVLT